MIRYHTKHEKLNRSDETPLALGAGSFRLFFSLVVFAVIPDSMVWV